MIQGAEKTSEWKEPLNNITRNLIAAIESAPTPPPPPDMRTVDILLQWLQPVSYPFFFSYTIDV